MTHERYKSKSTILLKIIALLSLLVTFFAFLIQIPSADDFLYARFFDESLGKFFVYMLWHYFSMNGRSFVHLIVAMLFSLSPWAVAFGAVFTLTAIAISAARRKPILKSLIWKSRSFRIGLRSRVLQHEL